MALRDQKLPVDHVAGVGKPSGRKPNLASSRGLRVGGNRESIGPFPVTDIQGNLRVTLRIAAPVVIVDLLPFSVTHQE